MLRFLLLRIVRIRTVERAVVARLFKVEGLFILRRFFFAGPLLLLVADHAFIRRSGRGFGFGGRGFLRGYVVKGKLCRRLERVVRARRLVIGGRRLGRGRAVVRRGLFGRGLRIGGLFPAAQRHLVVRVHHEGGGLCRFGLRRGGLLFGVQHEEDDEREHKLYKGDARAYDGAYKIEPVRKIFAHAEQDERRRREHEHDACAHKVEHRRFAGACGKEGDHEVRRQRDRERLEHDRGDHVERFRTEIGARDDARKIIEPDKQPGQNGDKARRKQHKEEFDEAERLMRGKQQHDERHDAKRERNDRRIERDIGIGIIEYIRKPQARIEQREDVEQNRQKQERRFEQIEFCRGAVALEDRNDGADEQHRICRDDQQQSRGVDGHKFEHGREIFEQTDDLVQHQRGPERRIRYEQQHDEARKDDKGEDKLGEPALFFFSGCRSRRFGQGHCIGNFHGRNPPVSWQSRSLPETDR